MKGKLIVLGVSGSIACYRACDLARELMRQGATVRVCLTDSAEKFVSRTLFEALTGQPCLMSAFDEPETGRMAHIDWARNADLLLVAPATANIINKLSAGIADDMLSTIALAYEGQLVLAPAMNPSMYAHSTTASSLERLRQNGARVVEPQEGEVACGEQGQGKLASVDEIVQTAKSVLNLPLTLKGKTILITSGPTREPIDDVRYLSNKSSGKMGAAIARAALHMGARVIVVSGPASVGMPNGAEVTHVTTAREMLAASLTLSSRADWIIGVAAVADFAIANPVNGKLRRSDGLPSFELVVNPDIIAELAASSPKSKTVAFAAEPGTNIAEARAKMARKNVAAIVVNDVSDATIGFESDQNELVLITDSSESRSTKMSKLECAYWLLTELSEKL